MKDEWLVELWDSYEGWYVVAVCDSKGEAVRWCKKHKYGFICGPGVFFTPL
jgi:hypothetical protein